MLHSTRKELECSHAVCKYEWLLPVHVFKTITLGIQFWGIRRHYNPHDLIESLPICRVVSRSPDFYQILPIYHEILKTRKLIDDL